MDRPLVGRKYRHYKGGEYKVIMFATCVDTKDEVVIYQSTQTGKVWARPLSDWNEPAREPQAPYSQERFVLLPDEEKEDFHGSD